MIEDHNCILVVDDESLSRDLLTDILLSIDNSMDVQQAANGEDALTYVLNNRVDIAFLDIDLPGLNGLVLAENLLRLKAPPIIVFATGSTEHAVRGFELHVVDYLVKPFLHDRVSEALARAQHALDEKTGKQKHHDEVQRVLNHALTDVNKMWAERDNGARVLIDFSLIGWAQAREKDVYIRTATEELKVRLTLNALQKRLPETTFVRVHRSWLVNINLVREVIPWDSHSMTLIMGDKQNTEIPVSRSYVGTFKQITGW